MIPRWRRDSPRLLEPPPRPLQSRTSAGEVYRRLPEVEAQLDELLHFPTHNPALTTRIEAGNVAPEPVRMEACAYFLREWHRKGETDACAWLETQMIGQMDGSLRRNLRALDDLRRDDAYLEVSYRVLRALYDLDRDAGEYYQVAFWSGVKRRCNDVYDAAYAKQRKEGRMRAADPRDRDDADDVPQVFVDADADPLHALVKDADTAWFDAALRYLGTKMEPRRVQAVSMRYRDGYTQYSSNPDDVTMCSVLNVTDRTLRNWFAQAHTVLRGWIEEGNHEQDA